MINMPKKRLCVRLLLLSISFLFSQGLDSKAKSLEKNQETTFVRGAIEGKTDTNLQGYSVFFDGRSIKTDKSGNFQIKTELDLSKDKIGDLTENPIYMLISSGIEWKKEPKTNTIKSAKQNPNKPYKCYEIRLTKNTNEAEPSLCATMKDLKLTNWKIPAERCVIFPINSFFIKDLKMPHKLFQGNIFNLPKLVLQDVEPLREHKSKTLLASGFDKETHDYRTKNVIPRGKDKGVLRSLDYKAFHEDTIFYVKQTKNSMKKPVEIIFYENA